MKAYLTLFFIAISIIFGSAKGIKVNFKGIVRPYTVKIEKIESVDNETLVFVKIKQQKNYSYSISFEDCYIAPSDGSGTPIKGHLKIWNGDKKNIRDTKTVSDSDEEKFILSFPGINLSEIQNLNIKIGNILDRKKTEIIFTDIPLTKK